MIYLKTSESIKLMKKAGVIAAGALEAAGKAIKPGISTFDIDKIICEYIRSKDAVPSCLGYDGFPAGSCISINEEVIHGIPSKTKIIKDGDIVSVDIVVGYQGYHGDNTATFAVGNISEDVNKLLKVTKRALDIGIEKAVVGNRIGDISSAIQSYVEENGFNVVRKFVGHGIGRHMHESPEVPNFGLPGKGKRLEPGMTIAIEPMVTMGSSDIKTLDDGWTIVTVDGKYAAHFEHTIAITDSKPMILTLL